MNDFERAAQALKRAGRTQRPSYPHKIETYQGNHGRSWVDIALLAIIPLFGVGLLIALL